MAYTSMSNGRARRIARTTEAAITKLVLRKPSGSDFAAPCLLYVSISKSFKVGDQVLAARGTLLSSVLKKPPFWSSFYGPCVIVKADYPCFNLKSVHNRYFRLDVRARRLRKFYPLSVMLLWGRSG